MRHHLGEQGEPLVELAAQRREAGTGAVPRRLAAELDPEPLGRLGEVGCVEPPGAGHQHLRREPGEPGVRLVLRRRARIGQEVDAHQLPVGQRDEPHAEAVVEALVREVGEPVGPRRAGDGASDHDAASAGT